MSKTTKLLTALLFSSLLLTSLSANEEKSSTLFYVKLGMMHPFDISTRSNDVLPIFGVGARLQKGNIGFDASANLATIALVNYASLKGVFLVYPLPEKRNQLYFGVGPGIGEVTDVFPSLFGEEETNELGMLTVEGVVGYEFRHTPCFKTFIQLELTQPVVRFSYRNDGRDYFKTAIALTVGAGF